MGYPHHTNVSGDDDVSTGRAPGISEQRQAVPTGKLAQPPGDAAAALKPVRNAVAIQHLRSDQ